MAGIRFGKDLPLTATAASGPTGGGRRHRFQPSRGAEEWLYYVAALGLAIVIWEVIARIFQPGFLPPFTDAFVRLIDMLSSGELIEFLIFSLQNLVMGFTIAAVAGLITGVLMGLFRPIETALEPYVWGLDIAPTIVFVPVYFSVFGLSPAAIVGLIVQYAVFIIIINTHAAVRDVLTEQELAAMARVYGASPVQVVRYVVLRAALPLIMTGLRLGLARSLKGMINGEFLIAIIGLGGAIRELGGRFDAEGVLALTIFLLAVSTLAIRGMQMIDKRVNHWLHTK